MQSTKTDKIQSLLDETPLPVRKDEGIEQYGASTLDGGALRRYRTVESRSTVLDSFLR